MVSATSHNRMAIASNLTLVSWEIWKKRNARFFLQHGCIDHHHRHENQSGSPSLGSGRSQAFGHYYFMRVDLSFLPHRAVCLNLFLINKNDKFFTDLTNQLALFGLIDSIADAASRTS